MTPRQFVALYLHLARNEQGLSQDLCELEGLLSKELCKHLSIAQFEQLQSLYEAGHRFEELEIDEML